MLFDIRQAHHYFRLIEERVASTGNASPWNTTKAISKVKRL
jgi:hypothetical protein